MTAGRAVATPGSRAALLALGAILVVTAAWWALALWPLPTDSPEWLVRTRAACFGVRPNGLPHAGGWVMLIGEPLGTTAILLAVWGDAIAGGLRALRASASGRLTLGAVTVATSAGLVAAAVRVAEARASGPIAVIDVGRSADSYERLDRAPPPLRLVDQRGDTVDLTHLRGRPVLLTFAYGHCQTVCPVVVHDLIAARERARDLEPVIVVVTVDPWRDTPSRLPHVTRSWGLTGDAYLLGGTVGAVEVTLDAWKVARSRDRNTGDVTHSGTVHLIDRGGRIAFSVVAPAGTIAALMRRL